MIIVAWKLLLLSLCLAEIESCTMIKDCLKRDALRTCLTPSLKLVFVCDWGKRHLGSNCAPSPPAEALSLYWTWNQLLVSALLVILDTGVMRTMKGSYPYFESRFVLFKSRYVLLRLYWKVLTFHTEKYAPFTNVSSSLPHSPVSPHFHFSDE